MPQWYEILYGTKDAPDEVLIISIMQTIFSAAMAFFFLLAVRNRFKVR